VWAKRRLIIKQVGETSANNKKSPEDLIYMLDLKAGGKRYEITT